MSVKAKSDRSFLKTLCWLHHLSTWRVTGLIVFTIPLGVLQGLVDISFGFCLLYFLGAFGLVQDPMIPSWLPHIDPVSLLLGTGLVRTLLLFLATLAGNLGYESFSVVLRNRLVDSLGGEDGALRISVADSSHILSNLISRSASFVSALAQITLGSLSLLVTVIGLSRLSLQLTAVAMGSFFIFGLPVIFTRRLFQGYSTRVYSGSNEFSQTLLKSLRNLEFLKIIGRTGAIRERLRVVNQTILKNYTRYISWLTLNSSWPQFGAICIVVAVVLVNQQKAWLAPTILVPFIYLLNRAAANMSVVISSLGNAQFNRPFLLNLMSQLNSASAEKQIILSGTEKTGKLESLTVSNAEIGRESSLLFGISFQAKAGDLVLFSGESGKGKSTLLMTLLGLLPTRVGSVSWNGILMENLDTKIFQSKIAFSGPDPFLLDLSIRDNLLMGSEHLKPTEKEIQDALATAVCDFVRDLPQGINSKLLEGGEGISAGQKQRLSIARALLRKPDVLVLDEATANIDIEQEANIIRGIRAKFPDAFLLVVSHRRSLEGIANVKVTL